jgi:hypothetical protein
MQLPARRQIRASRSRSLCYLLAIGILNRQDGLCGPKSTEQRLIECQPVASRTLTGAFRDDLGHPRKPWRTILELPGTIIIFKKMKFNFNRQFNRQSGQRQVKAAVSRSVRTLATTRVYLISPLRGFRPKTNLFLASPRAEPKIQMLATPRTVTRANRRLRV